MQIRIPNSGQNLAFHKCWQTVVFVLCRTLFYPCHTLGQVQTHVGTVPLRCAEEASIPTVPDKLLLPAFNLVLYCTVHTVYRIRYPTLTKQNRVEYSYILQFTNWLHYRMQCKWSYRMRKNIFFFSFLSPTLNIVLFLLLLPHMDMCRTAEIYCTPVTNLIYTNWIW